MDKFIVATGWCVPDEKRTDTLRSDKFEKPNYFQKYFFPHIYMQTIPDVFMVYESNSKIRYDDYPHRVSALVNIPAIQKYNDGVSYRHDWWASFLLPAAYAWANKRDLVYVEQDCLVVGLESALNWAKEQKAKICYGYGDNSSFAYGWAATSFTYISLEYLPVFIARLAAAGVLTHREVKEYFEITWQKMFGEDATYWPFGYDRKRPIDFSQKMFYAQQMTDVELDKFAEILNLEV